MLRLFQAALSVKKATRTAKKKEIKNRNLKTDYELSSARQFP